MALKRVHGRKWIARAVLAVSMLVFSPGAWAQDAPKTISPLRIEPDGNGVNLADGKIQQPVPTLSVPAAPRLTFDLV
jgi:hypothetical protein